MRVLNPLLALFVSVVSASPAIATGYGGVGLGWERRPDFFATFDASGLQESRDTSNALAVGVFGGYRLPLSSRISILAEAEVGRSTGETTLDDVAGLVIETKSSWTYLGSIRAAVAVTETVEVYGLAGYGGSRFRQRLVSTGTVFPASTASNARWVDDVTYGGGMAVSLNDHWFGRIEYRRRDQFVGSLQQVALGVGYRF